MKFPQWLTDRQGFVCIPTHHQLKRVAHGPWLNVRWNLLILLSLRNFFIPVSIYVKVVQYRSRCWRNEQRNHRKLWRRTFTGLKQDTETLLLSSLFILGGHNMATINETKPLNFILRGPGRGLIQSVIQSMQERVLWPDYGRQWNEFKLFPPYSARIMIVFNYAIQSTKIIKTE